MKVAVIGPGAMGCMYAALLERAGIQTTLVDYLPDRATKLKESGVTVELADGQTLSESPVVATSVPAGQDLVVVLVKAYATADLKIPSNIPVLTLQNGLGNVEALCATVGSANVLAGVSSQAAELIDIGHARQVASGKVTVGAWTSCPTAPAEEALAKVGAEVELTESPGQLIWEATTINSAVHPLTALLGVTNSQLIDQPDLRQLMRDLVVEAVKVSATEGYRFSYSLVEKAEEICEATRDQSSAMLHDVRAGKKTEVDAITGEILRRAQNAGLPTPRTRVVWQLLRGLEQH
jgi:2-dehydropantoate 2-reductase